jgi:hypothetical protein
MIRQASSSIERCMRMCKFKMNKNLAPNLHPHITSCDFDSPAWSMGYAHGDLSVLSRVYPHIDRKAIGMFNSLQQNIRTYALPATIAEQQNTTLTNIFGACDYSMDATRCFHVCCTCTVNGKGFKNKMRMCGLTSRLMCDECDAYSILKIDMVGVLLRLGNHSLYMCPICCQIRIWAGDGSDFTSCTCTRIVNKPDKRIGCSVCESRYVVMGPLIYPDFERQRLARVYLCGKHVVPKHTMSFIHDYQGLQRAIRHKCHK